MQVLVSGARGFIGSSLVARLEAEGHVVHRIVRGEPGPGEVRLDVTGRRVDASRLVAPGLESVDVVFHLSGEPITPWRWSASKRERMRASRVATTDVLARCVAGLEGAPPTLVTMSAVGYYGDRGDEILDESSPAGSGTLAELCRAWESACAPAAEAGARVVNARCGVVLGSGGGSLRLQLPIFRAGLGGRLGSGRQWTSWISLADAVGGLVHLATTPSLAGPCNLTAPAPVRNADLTAAIGAAVGRPALLAVPRPVLDLVAGRETTAEFLCASQRAVPRKLEDSGYEFVHRVVDAALADALSGHVDGSTSDGRAGAADG